ncbi:Phenoloxidase 2 [Orchesella cincta]|uniref:Phenoloxidase 2 n=1 Tax=Orchesella cincta TaxID=48709 RepID=A0A1D2N860_ORCCI|nr:Phenoloxidase 2 [Orchesella cincta]
MIYNAERISNGLPLVKEFDIRPGAEIGSGYNSYLADVRSGKFWTPRLPHTTLSDIIHEKDPDFERNIFLDHYNELYGRLVRSIEVGHLLTGPYSTLPIRNIKGIEHLSNTVEATESSVNPLFYDAMGFHNLGHQIIGLQSDPYFKAGVPTGVMADTATTMKDPEFYTYHTLVDSIFDRYKKSLPPYQPKGGKYQLRWDGVEILDVQVISQNKGPPNQLRTYWSRRRFDLSPGVDQSIHKGDVDLDICAVHLNHEPFDFKITVTLDPCAHTKSNKGTVRLFMAPRYNEHGLRFSMKAQRRLMIQMDVFPVDLRVGRNVIFRRSLDSNVVKPWSKSINEYLEDDDEEQTNADFCGCGWPTHLFIPKGTHKGLAFDFFAMITNFDEDYVEENPDDLYIPEPCNSPYIYCGIPWRKYPDAKPMGYPFDRSPPKVPIDCPPGMGAVLTLFCRFFRLFWYTKIHTLEDYVKIAPNMAATVVEIKHFDKLVW